MSDPTENGRAFWHQPAAERTLHQAATSGRLSRALLFAGPEGVGKWAAAIWTAQAILCRELQAGKPCGVCRDCARVSASVHPDLHLLFPVPSKSAEDDTESFISAKREDPFAVVRFDKRPYIILDRIRALITELHRTAVEGGAKVVIIHAAEQMKDEDCQSVLLKTIEEPPPGAHFILTSAAPERLLPTIRSRCQLVRFVPVDPQVIAERLSKESGIDSETANLAAQLSSGGWGTARRLASEEFSAWRELTIEFWNGAFRSTPAQLLAQIDAIFPSGKKSPGFDALLQAFDVWCLCAWQNCLELASDTDRHGPIRNLDVGWGCWHILQRGRSSLYVNVAARHAVAGTFLDLRMRLDDRRNRA